MVGTVAGRGGRLENMQTSILEALNNCIKDENGVANTPVLECKVQGKEIKKRVRQ
jgi:hypothetical protein